MKILNIQATKSRIVKILIWIFTYVLEIIISPYIQLYLNEKYNFGLLMNFIINNLQLIIGISLMIFLLVVLVWWYIRDNIIRKMKDVELLSRYCTATLKSYKHSPHDIQMTLNFNEEEIRRVAILVNSIRDAPTSI